MADITLANAVIYDSAGKIAATAAVTLMEGGQSFSWDEDTATLTVGNSTQIPIIQFPTSSISAETGEFRINAEGVEGVLIASSSYGDIHINITNSCLFAAYGTGGYQGGDFFNFNRRVRLDQANTDDQPSAQLNVASTTRGVVLPRMTTTQKNAITSPVEGLEVYDLSLHKKCIFTGTVWETVTSS